MLQIEVSDDKQLEQGKYNVESLGQVKTFLLLLMLWLPVITILNEEEKID